jgi:hypothetical protein
VRQQTVPPNEIIVVVDHNPALLAQLRQHLPDIRAIENWQPRGLSGARNSGIAIASGEVVVFIDEDATAAPDWLEQLESHYDREDVLGFGGAIKPVWLPQRPRWLPAEFDWVVGCTYRGLPETASRVRNLIGCNMSLRREAFQQTAGFRSGIGRVSARPVGCEETELCIRLLQQQPQGRLIYEPGARFSPGTAGPIELALLCRALLLRRTFEGTGGEVGGDGREPFSRARIHAAHVATRFGAWPVGHPATWRSERRRPRSRNRDRTAGNGCSSCERQLQQALPARSPTGEPDRATARAAE